MRCKICGREKLMLSSTIRLKSGTTHKACGKGLKTKDPVFYDRWQAMRTRTNNPNYEHSECYIDRGINSDEFENFIDFYDTMYDSFQKKVEELGDQHLVSLERIDVDGNYSKENCTWIDIHDQQINKRNSVKFKVIFPDDHIEYHTSIPKFAQEYGLDTSTINDCMNPNRSTSQHRGYKFQRIEPRQPVIFN